MKPCQRGREKEKKNNKIKKNISTDAIIKINMTFQQSGGPLGWKNKKGGGKFWREAANGDINHAARDSQGKSN